MMFGARSRGANIYACRASAGASNAIDLLASNQCFHWDFAKNLQCPICSDSLSGSAAGEAQAAAAALASPSLGKAYDLRMASKLEKCDPGVLSPCWSLISL